MAAANALAELVSPEELSADYIIPAVAKAVAEVISPGGTAVHKAQAGKAEILSSRASAAR